MFCDKEVLVTAPVRKLRLEFQLPEDVFLNHVTVAEKTVEEIKQQVEAKMDFKQLLEYHKVCNQIQSYRVICMLPIHTHS